MRVVEQPLHKRVLLGRFSVAKDTRQQAHDRVYHGHRSDFATRQYEITERQFVIYLIFNQAFVDALVAAREQYHTGHSGKPSCLRLVENTSLRRKADNRTILRQLCPGSRYRFGDRLVFHDHTGAATVRSVVHCAMRVVCECPRVLAMQRHQLPLDCSSHDTIFGDATHHFREDADNRDSQDVSPTPSRR